MIELLDFYYSATMEERFDRDPFKTHRCLFNGHIYTECIAHGKAPVCNVTDAEFLGTGTNADIRIQGEVHMEPDDNYDYDDISER
jgi:hypothetical protein